MSDIHPKKLVILYILDILQKYTDEEHRLSQKEIQDILKREYETVIVPDSKREATYFSKKKTGIILSHIGASQAISLGAYAFALHKLDGVSCS